MQNKEFETFYPTSPQHWRQWLQEHHATKSSIWLLQYKKKANQPTLSWSEAVDEALCFGWIDSTKRSVDDDSFIQYYSPRKPRSVWSKINKDKVQQLISEGRMTPAGLACIEIAKQNGSWNTLDEAETLAVPAELERILETMPGASEYFMGLSKSSRKAILQWLALAKLPETRLKRMTEIATLAAQQLKPKQFR